MININRGSSKNIGDSILTKRLNIFDKIDLYPVLCEELSLGRSNLEVAKSILDGGARIIQYREKNKSLSKKYQEGKKLLELAKTYECLIIINDDIEMAIDLQADGVHLGQGDMSVREARQLSQDLIIGCSTHNFSQFREAGKQGANYINIGPVFATGTKPGMPALGLETLENIVKKVQSNLNFPRYTFMGGIKPSHFSELIELKPAALAMVTAITQAKSVNETVSNLCFKIRELRKK